MEGWARVTASPEAVVTEAEGAAKGLTRSLGRGNRDTLTRLNAQEESLLKKAKEQTAVCQRCAEHRQGRDRPH